MNNKFICRIQKQWNIQNTQHIYYRYDSRAKTALLPATSMIMIWLITHY